MSGKIDEANLPVAGLSLAAAYGARYAPAPCEKVAEDARDGGVHGGEPRRRHVHEPHQPEDARERLHVSRIRVRRDDRRHARRPREQQQRDAPRDVVGEDARVARGAQPAQQQPRVHNREEVEEDKVAVCGRGDADATRPQVDERALLEPAVDVGLAATPHVDWSHQRDAPVELVYQRADQRQIPFGHAAGILQQRREGLHDHERVLAARAGLRWLARLTNRLEQATAA